MTFSGYYRWGVGVRQECHFGGQVDSVLVSLELHRCLSHHRFAKPLSAGTGRREHFRRSTQEKPTEREQ